MEALDDDPRLAAPRAGQHEARTVAVLDGDALLFVERGRGAGFRGSGDRHRCRFWADAGDRRVSQSADNPEVDTQPVEDDPSTASVAAALQWLRHARRILVFTGAGISTEFGIPDFRGPNGIWRTTDPARYTIESYVSDRAVRVERWRARLDSPLLQRRAEPGAPGGHAAAAGGGRAGRGHPEHRRPPPEGRHTQRHRAARHVCGGNLSRLQAAHADRRRARPGSRGRRGSALRASVATCSRRPRSASASRSWRRTWITPARRPAPATSASRSGSTLSVWPAAGIPVEAVRSGARLVIVNEGATDLDGMATLILSGRAGAVMSELAAAVLGDGDSR